VGDAGVLLDVLPVQDEGRELVMNCTISRTEDRRTCPLPGRVRRASPAARPGIDVVVITAPTSISSMIALSEALNDTVDLADVQVAALVEEPGRTRAGNGRTDPRDGLAVVRNRNRRSSAVAVEVGVALVWKPSALRCRRGAPRLDFGLVEDDGFIANLQVIED